MQTAIWQAALARLGELGRIEGLSGLRDADSVPPLVQALLVRWADDAEALQAAVTDIARLQGE